MRKVAISSGFVPANVAVAPGGAGTVGTVDGVEYESLTCPIADGTHRLRADRPVGIFVYGYDTAGSYAYFGGSNIRVINPPI